jgi:pimeloyl-ACP methyl ester carboxylesterase
MAAVSAALAANMKNTPTGKLSAGWSQPERFPRFLDRMGKVLGQDYDWSAEVKRLPMPVMLVYTDHDSVSQAHIAEFFALLGGGISEPGWQNTKFTKARLAIVPGYSHYNFVTAPEIAPIIDKFLADPMTGASTGAAAASTAGPAPDKR